MKFIVLFAALLTLASTAHANVTETFKQTHPLTADGVVHLENVNGDIDITAWDKTEISIEADKNARDDDELKRLEITVEAQPTKISVKTNYVKKSGWSFFSNWNQGSVRYKLMVPAGTRLDKISSVNSNITVTGVHGAVELNTVNGSVKASGLMADAQLESVNGSLSANFDSLENTHRVKLESVNGGIEITLPKGASANLTTQSVIGSTQVDQAIKLNKSGHLGVTAQIGSGGPSITLQTVNGSVAVHEK